VDYLLALLPTALLVGCVVHAVRTGRIFPWIYVIVFLPGIGSLIYLGVEVVPELLRGRASRRLAEGVRAAADPHRGFREARRAADLVGSVDAKRALAEEHVARREYAQAIALYEGMLSGQFQDDPVLLQGLARARFLAGDGAGAQAALDALQKADPNFVSADAHLLYARALELQGKDAEAREEYRRLIGYFAGEEARCRYAMLLDRLGEKDEARALYREILKLLEGAPRHYRRAQKEWGDIARAALR
jgi:hypothetical protein